MKKTTAQKIYRTLIIAVVALLVTRGIMFFKAPRDFEAKLFDIRQLAFPPKTVSSSDVVMVWLDENTMKGLPFRTPIPRNFLATLHDKIAEAGPKLIAYDIFFKGASFPGDDEKLAKALGEYRAYAVVPMRAEGIVDMPDEMFMKGLKGVGLADLPFNSFDSTVREASFIFDTDRGPMRSFAAELFFAATGSDASELIADKKNWPGFGHIKLTPYVGGGEKVYIRFAGPPSKIGDKNNQFKTYSAALVAKGFVPKGWLKDKIVLVGASYEDLKDSFLTPYYAASMGYAQMNGVEIHANILSELLTSKFYFTTTMAQTWVGVFLIALAIGAAAVILSPWSAGIIFLVISAIEVLLSVVSFMKYGIVVPIVAPLIGSTAAYGSGLGLRALTEGKQKRFIKGVFSKYVPRAVVERMTQNPELVKLGGQQRIVTSLFSDIASFTTISEKMEPTELVEFLNDYLGRMNEMLFSFGATIDKYEGDAIIAFFNAPLDVVDHEAKAMRAAIEMRRITSEVSSEWSERLGRELVTRVGINTGPAVVGNMGSEGRFDYTAIGDTINLASRLEGTNKFYNTILMASEMTVARGGDDLIVRPVDRVRVKGKAEPILLYEIVGVRGHVDESIISEKIEPYQKAFDLFTHRNTVEAKSELSGVISTYPDDGPALELKKRIEKAGADPKWDLVTDLESK
jgi:class 3 adenylate cyclase/CHASE2 domain-containing sensor protein